MRARSKLILVVDDNEPQRYATAHLLREAGFRISEAGTGTDALARIAAEPPDLIILDVHLPDINGMDVCRRLKSDAATAHIPVLHLSATFTSAEDRALGLETGADGYLTHPVEQVELIATVRSLLRLAAAEAERGRLSAQVDAQTELIKAIVATSPDHIYLFDRDGRYAYANAAGALAIGVDPQQVVGKSWRDLRMPVDIMAPFEGHVKQVFATGDSYRGETDFPVGGATHHYDYVLSPVYRDGEIGAVLCAVRDATDRELALNNERLARRAAEAAEARIANILESITDAFFTVDRQWRFAYVNREAERLLRHKRKKLLGQVVWDLFPGADAFRRQYETALAEDRAVHFEEFYGPLGNTWFEVHAYPSAEGLSVYFRDVTARKSAEATVQYAKEVAERAVAQFQTVVEAMNEALVVFDPSGKLLLSNPAFARMYDLQGRVPENREGFQRVLELRDSSGHVLAPSEWPSLRAFRGETLLNYELRVRNTLTGHQFDSRHTAIPVRDAEGRILLVVLTVEDITATKQAEAELRLAKDLAETSAAQLATAMESMAEGVVAVDAQLRVILKNTAFARLYGFSSPSELPERLADFPKLVDVFDLQGRRLPAEEWPVRRALAGEVVRDYELRVLRRTTGTEMVARYNASPVLDARGNVLMAVVTVEDITERRSIEEALRQSDERLRVSALAAEIGVWTWDVRTGQVMVGANWKRLFGVPPTAEVTYQTWVNVLHPEDRERADQALAAAMREGRDFNLEYRVVWPDGEIRWIIDRGRGSYDETGQCLTMSGVNVDITKRKNAEEQLFAAKQYVEALMKAVPVGISFSASPKCQNITGNPAALAQFEVGPEDNLSPSAVDLAAAGRQMQFYRNGRLITDAELPLQRAVAENREIPPMELEVRLPSGRRWFADASGAPIRDAQGNVIAGVAVTVDVTERKQAEEALRASEGRLRLALDAGDAGTWEWNLLTNEVIWSEELWDVYGIAPHSCEPNLDNWLKTVHPDDRERVVHDCRAAFHHRQDLDFEYRTLAPDGTLRWIYTRGRMVRNERGEAVRMFGINMDVTARKQSEQALRNTEKLAAAGRLAAVLAHEINNPMAAVTNLIYLLSANNSLDPVGRSYVDLAQQELARIAHITKQMLGFCREPLSPEVMRFHEVLDGVLDLYDRRISRASVKVERRYDFRDPVHSFSGEVRQVFSNLVVNALDAMGEGGGKLRLRVRYAHEPGTGRRGVRIVIADTGPGIAYADRKRVFEPFFTTKGERGTGLGLWVTQGIVEKHGGTLRLRSSTRPGHSGTCFSIFFPTEAARAAATG